MNKIEKCSVLLAVSSKCLNIHYNKEYSCTIRMLLHHLVGKLLDDSKLIIQACVFRVERPFVCLSINLWGNLKNKVYKTNPHTLDELTPNIRTEINAISEAELMRVNANFLRRCRRCIDAKG